jgi:ABC-type transport system substrate-binding protein
MTYMVGKNRCQWDQTVEDLASVLTVHHNSYISATTAAFNLSCHTDTKVDEMYRQIKLAATEGEQYKIGDTLQRYMLENMFWVNLTTSPHFKAIRKHVQDFDYQGELKFLLEKVWVEK